MGSSRIPDESQKFIVFTLPRVLEILLLAKGTSYKCFCNQALEKSGIYCSKPDRNSSYYNFPRKWRRLETIKLRTKVLRLCKGIYHLWVHWIRVVDLIGSVWSKMLRKFKFCDSFNSSELLFNLFRVIVPCEFWKSFLILGLLVKKF